MNEEKVTKVLRSQLYEEIWKHSLSKISKKYEISYSELVKACKAAEIPTPPAGYSTKLEFGKPVAKTPLPDSTLIEVELKQGRAKDRSLCKEAQKTDKAIHITKQEIETNNQELKMLSSDEDIVAKNENLKEIASIHNTYPDVLTFLSEEEKGQVLLAAKMIKLPVENERIHKKILSYKSVITEWNKNDRKPEGAQRKYSNYNYSNRPPFLAGVISAETLPRVFRILDALFRQVESLGGSVSDNLFLKIRNETVHLEVVESQDEVEHQLTKQEAQALIIYEDEKRRHKWASAPQIRKYDYVFNGKLRISIRQGKYFRDTAGSALEDRLGEMLIELYEESEIVRLQREAHEEEARKREEEARLKEERRRLYDQEIEKTVALENEALDYEKACRIRAYVTAIENSCELDEETEAWVNWAKKKADWYDPIKARKDEFFGQRQHEKSEEIKALKKPGYNWW